MGNGVFLVLLINFGLYAGANLLHLPALSNLALSHWKPQWWQFVTSTFMHANWQHLRWAGWGAASAARRCLGGLRC